MREPGSKGHTNGRSNLEELRGKIGVYVIFEGDEENALFDPVYVGASGAKEGKRGNLAKALLRHFYEYADDANDRGSLYHQLKLFDQLQDRTSYHKKIKKFDYFFRAYIFPDALGKSKAEAANIKEAIRLFEIEKIRELKPRDNPPPLTDEERRKRDEEAEEVPF
jgi:hypothetical protein